MKAIFTEHRNLILASAGFLLCAGGSGYYLYQASEANSAALTELQTVSSNLTKIQGATPSPDKDNLEKLTSQREEATKALEHLTSEVKGLNLAAADLKPTDFQKILNEKSQAITKLAEANSVTIPQNFYFNFNNYTKSVPKESATPHLGRQLHVAELLCKLLIQTVPFELKSFERTELDLEKDPSSVSKEKESPPSNEKEKSRDKADKDKTKDKSKPKDPPKPIFESSFFRLSLISRPANLREFLNAIASEKSCILVTRKLKVENEKQKGPSKKGPELDALGGGLPTGTNLPPPVGIAPEPIALGLGTNPSSSPAPEVSQFIVGDEKIEVTMLVEFVSFAEEPLKQP